MSSKKNYFYARNVMALAIASAFVGVTSFAYANDDVGLSSNQDPTKAVSADERIDQLTRQVEELKKLVLQQHQQTAAPAAAVQTTPSSTEATATATEASATPAIAPKTSADLLRGITINAMYDGYYEYNANSPIGRTNTLRAYDVSSNSFSMNQADLMLESAPDVAAGKRAGFRIDFQYGQATESMQGNPANELRPEVYRNVYQAFGTYVAPVGDGLTIDFGKWASSLGLEGNYTKDQLNYTRSWWFNYLPFYHSGVRAKYVVNDKVAVNMWLTNGTQQTEDFNNYKDQLLGLVLTPTPEVSWTINYYRGQEHPDVSYITNPSPAQQNLPNIQGTYIQPIANPADGKLNIIDSYATWQVTPELSLSGELDYVSQRLYSDSPAGHVKGGAIYMGYQFSPKFAVAARAEYLNDQNGLFSGKTQILKESTLTFDYRPEDNFLIRTEFRRDQSNSPYFLGHTTDELKTSQSTVTVGLVWWFGQKDGAW